MPLVRRHNDSPSGRALRILSSDAGIAVLTVIAILGIYLLDAITPLGQPVWLLYLVPLVISYWSERYYAIPVVCGVIALFLAAGLFLSPQGIAITGAFLMRLIFFLFFISFALVLQSIKSRGLLRRR